MTLYMSSDQYFGTILWKKQLEPIANVSGRYVLGNDGGQLSGIAESVQELVY